MKLYVELDLPPLPPPWSWECGDLDGDPIAVLHWRGWIVRVHEGHACEFSENLAVTLRPDPSSSTRQQLGGGTGPIPFRVFDAVHRAVRQWYEQPEES